jgi:hypothetical protein
MTKGLTAIIIMKNKTIQHTYMDCFILQIRNDEGSYSYRLCECSEAIHARTLNCFASCLATLRKDDNRNIFRHCERSEAIYVRTLDCFTLRVRNDGAAGRLHQSLFSLSVLPKCSVFFPMMTQIFHFATI